MATSSSLIKTILHKSLADGVYRDVATKSSNYYYFLGKTLKWKDDLTPPFPTDSYAYERATRDEIITMKAIGPSDVSFVIPRVNWNSGTVYDMYDDEYHNEILGLNVINGGSGYTSLPVITITGGGGTGAKFYPIVAEGQIVGIESDMVALEARGIIDASRGSGYTSQPSVTITGGAGTGAVLEAVINRPYSGATILEDSIFYIMTEDYNVYKCLDNNNNSLSTVKPLGTSTSAIYTSDGYVWKYMYNVPINLRNKFLSDEQMPVISALTNQFYSNGAMDSIIINNKGKEYTTATLTVNGDGYREEDPIFLSSIDVVTSGVNYSSPTIVIGEPINDSSAFIATSTAFLGQKIRNSTNDYYEVATGGTLSSSEPTHRLGTVQNGTTALKYIGTRAKATATTTASTAFAAGAFVVGYNYTIASLGTTTNTQWNTIAGTSGVTYTVGSTFTASTTGVGGTGVGTATYKIVNQITLVGAVRELNLTNAGSGYNSAPSVNFARGSGDTTGSGAIAVCKMNAGSVLYVTVQNPGDNYTVDPIVTFGTEWTALSPVLVSEQYYSSNRLYTVSSAGYFGSAFPTHTTGNVVNSPAFAFSTALTLNSTVYVSNRLYKVTTAGTTSVGTTPTHTTGTVTNGTAALLYLGEPASLTYAGVPATAEVVRRYGAGYSSVPSVAITDSTGLNATASFKTTKSEAKLLPVISAGQIVGVIVENKGVGYSTATITISGDGKKASLAPDLNIGTIQSLQANNEILAVPGTVNAVKIVSGGYGYGVATVQINGDGTGAQAIATINTATGKISKINITNPGQDYTFADIVIIGNGHAATARAIMCPNGGHGKNAPDELFARTLMFYSNISTDLNQGVAVNNDYRQLGIIKNPNIYGTDQRFQGVIGSACFIVEGSINTSNFKPDTNITVERLIGGESFQRHYRIVSVSSSGALLQSLDNDTPQINDSFVSATGAHTFSISYAGYPTIDKYSGQLMFIDNKAGFTPSADETVTLRTVIRF